MALGLTSRISYKALIAPRATRRGTHYASFAKRLAVDTTTFSVVNSWTSDTTNLCCRRLCVE